MKNIKTGIQLNKYIADAGVCSRRKAQELVKEGKVRINSTFVSDPGIRIEESDVVYIRGKKIQVAKKKWYVVVNKPADCVTTAADEYGRKTIFDVVKVPGAGRLFSIGRLDRNTTGILLLTNDGFFAQKLSHPRFGAKKSYTVVLHKPLTEQAKNKLLSGVRLTDGVSRFDTLSPVSSFRQTVIRVTLHSGKNRIIKRMFNALGYQVEKLDRNEFAGIVKNTLRIGQWRQLNVHEVNRLKKTLSV